MENTAIIYWLTIGDREQEAAGGTLANYTRVIHTEDLPRISILIGEPLESVARYEAEYRVVQSDGSHQAYS